MLGIQDCSGHVAIELVVVTPFPFSDPYHLIAQKFWINPKQSIADARPMWPLFGATRKKSVCFYVQTA